MNNLLQLEDVRQKLNRRCLLSIENYVEQFQPDKYIKTTSLDLRFLYTYIVTTNRSFTYGDAKDSYHTASFAIK